MSRRFPPCDVPGCKGQMEPGSRDGRTTAWCRTCERRLAQLTALHEKVRALEAAPARVPAAAAPTMSDGELLGIIAQRVVTLRGAVALTRRGLNSLYDGARRQEIPYLQFGRVWFFGRESLLAWSATRGRDRRVMPATREIIAALPREEARAISQDTWASSAQRTTHAIALWQRKHVRDPRLRRRATLDAKGRAVTLFWWQEDAPNA